MGSGVIAPRIDLGTRWRRVVNFKPLPLYPGGRGNRFSLDRKLVGMRWRRENPSLFLPGIQPWSSTSQPSHYTDSTTPGKRKRTTGQWSCHAMLIVRNVKMCLLEYVYHLMMYNHGTSTQLGTDSPPAWLKVISHFKWCSVHPEELSESNIKVFRKSVCLTSCTSL